MCFWIPDPISEIDFNEINNIKNKTKIKHVGFSDHTDGLEASLEAINKNVYLIERHFTLKNSKSPDVKFSLTPNELKILKDYSVSKEIFTKKNKSRTSENASKIFRRSIYALKILTKTKNFHQKTLVVLDQILVLVQKIIIK